MEKKEEYEYLFSTQTSNKYKQHEEALRAYEATEKKMSINNGHPLLLHIFGVGTKCGPQAMAWDGGTDSSQDVE